MQQLRSSGPLLGWAVQAASSSVTTSLSRSVPGKRETPGKFNFGASKGEGGGGGRRGEGGRNSGGCEIHFKAGRGFPRITNFIRGGFGVIRGISEGKK